MYSNGHKKGNVSLGKFDISGTSNIQILQLQQIIDNLDATWKAAKYPIFNCQDHWIWALFAVSLGCYQYISGVNGLGPALISKILNDIYANTTNDDNFRKNHAISSLTKFLNQKISTS